MDAQIGAIITTEFDSFDESELGGFVESPLGARNYMKFLDLVLFIGASDRDNKAYHLPGNESIARDDLNLWNTALSLYPDLQVQIAQFPPPFGTPEIWNSSVDFPRNVEVVAIEQPPSTDDIDRLYEDIVTTQRNNIVLPHGIKILTVIGVLEHIEPTFSQLLERLTITLGDEAIAWTNSSERWLLQIVFVLTDLVQSVD